MKYIQGQDLNLCCLWGYFFRKEYQALGLKCQA